MHIASLDIEATRSGENQIIEIGILFMDNDVEVGRFNTLIDPQVPLTHLNNSISSITDDMVQGKSRIDQVLPNLLEALRGWTTLEHGIQLIDTPETFLILTMK